MRNMAITFILLLSMVMVVLYSNYIHHERIEKMVRNASDIFCETNPEIIDNPYNSNDGRLYFQKIFDYCRKVYH